MSTGRSIILQAAVKLFSRRGFNGTQVSEIAAMCGRSHDEIIAAFGSKENLYTACMTAVTDNNLIDSPLYKAAESGTMEQLFWTVVHDGRKGVYTRDFLRLRFFSILENRDMSGEWHETLAQLGMPAIKRIKREQRQGKIRDDVSARAVLQGISYAVMMRCLMDTILADQGVTERSFDDYLKIWLRGISTVSTES